jgi:hypothetical protein
VTSPAFEWSRTVPRNTQVPPAPGSATNANASSADSGSGCTRVRMRVGERSGDEGRDTAPS